MFARSSTLGLLAAVALTLPSAPATEYAFQSSGAVALNVAGTEASYGLTPEKVDGKPVLAISLGATAAEGWLALYTDGEELPRIGRYPIYFAQQHDGVAGDGRWFHACFVAGTFDHPLGVFHGESGWVTITGVEDGRISAEFEVRARGFLATDSKDEDRWVTVRGIFTAEGDSTIAGIGTVAAAGR